MSRGNYVLTNILGTPPPEPPPDVPTLPENTAEKLSMRARMERHRADPVCASCHQLMDPIGLVLESYDGIGRWRTEDNGDPSASTAARSTCCAISAPSAAPRTCATPS